ncbi:MAG: zinc-binding alcohol dehydrogenase [Gemmatimonadetes bacterium]|nr:zinc-binding alcohol dehydrogenase [Gemmatimonadota bacterium]
MADSNSAKQFWIRGPRHSEIVEATISPTGPDQVLVRTRFSGISHGTEMLVYRGLVPESEYRSMRAPFQEGDFPGPVKYGYVSVGEVIEQTPASSGADTRDLVGRPVFCLYPHQTRYWVPRDAVVPIPDGVPAERAVLAANMETAINAVWDGGASLGDRVVVVGAGVVGLLIGWLVGRIPGADVTVVDLNPSREAVAEALGVSFRGEVPNDIDADLVFHASGNPEGALTALSAGGEEAKIVEVSWFGSRSVPLPLGGAFHSRRLTLRSSQVGSISPLRAPRWTARRRLELALTMLQHAELEVLISGESDFEGLPDLFQRLERGSEGPLCHRIGYP